MKILVTAFDPFGGESINPAQEAVRLLPKKISGADIETLFVPTVFHLSAQQLEEKWASSQPDVVLCIGQAGGRPDLTPERVAINLDDARIPDNQGQAPIDASIRPDGPAAYFSTLPIKAMVQAIRQVGLPASVSNSAGTFVCNHLMYQALYLAENRFPNSKAGFLHIPFLPQQVVDKPGLPSMSLADIVRGLEAAIEALVQVGDGQDILMQDGKTH
ncbi:pyroglutamyl-peptidase I [Streptococcus suis]|uniref:Pyrrolidone-carboxylate peptidase n=1 Tax=Streptococcus suivaginalis TaxID=3028082 RepID=A0AA96ZZQ7_9STRE|nr:pyroglutamyl-peptidase I [Streptococcus sp. 29896]MCK4027482.1 pyroglutamyl-peptidase I [Streptococcus suis]WNY47928.1 pyroglutamyl-peptidase I [Streptococcus sp. 29896]